MWVLAHAHAHPALTANLGNIALLRMAGERNLVPAPLADAAADAYREFRRVQHRVRLTGAKPMTGEDIAAAILWVAELPPHLNINRLELMPVSQSFAATQVARAN